MEHETPKSLECLLCSAFGKSTLSTLPMTAL